MTYLLLALIFFPKSSLASYEAGKAVAEGSIHATQKAASLETLKASGLTVSEQPPERRFQDVKTLQREGDLAKVRDSHYQHLQKSKDDREDYTFDLDASLSRLDGGLETMETERVGQKTHIRKTCQRQGDMYHQTCQRERIVTLEVLPELGHHNPRYCPGHRESRAWGTKHVLRHCGGCAGGEYVIDRPKTVNILRDEWVGCEAEESLRDTGVAELEALTPGVVENPKIIQGEPVAGDIWEETRVYRVGTDTQDTCAPLRALGCVDEGGKCTQPKRLSDGTRICLEYEHVFRCEAGQTAFKSPKDLHLQTADLPTYLPTYTANQNMGEALARLEGLKQASLFMEKDSASVISIFKGESRRCSTNFGGAFKDCCKSTGGRGVRMRLATSCTPEEVELAAWRSQKRCVFVGSRQTKNTFGMNLSKEYVYCCFPSLLARAIQQGGRAQLGLDFGTARAPNCNGFTPHGLQRLDWGRLDLSEALEDVMTSAKQAGEALQQDFAQKQRALSKPLEKERRKSWQTIQESGIRSRVSGYEGAKDGPTL